MGGVIMNYLEAELQDIYDKRKQLRIEVVIEEKRILTKKELQDIVKNHTLIINNLESQVIHFKWLKRDPERDYFYLLKCEKQIEEYNRLQTSLKLLKAHVDTYQYYLDNFDELEKNSNVKFFPYYSEYGGTYYTGENGIEQC